MRGGEGETVSSSGPRTLLLSAENTEESAASACGCELGAGGMCSSQTRAVGTEIFINVKIFSKMIQIYFEIMMMS